MAEEANQGGNTLATQGHGGGEIAVGTAVV